jgi:hypothetical protein
MTAMRSAQRLGELRKLVLPPGRRGKLESEFAPGLRMHQEVAALVDDENLAAGLRGRAYEVERRAQVDGDDENAEGLTGRRMNGGRDP